LSSNQEIAASLKMLRARSRQLARDNPYMVSFLNLLRTNVVGSNGIRLQSHIVDANGKPRDFFNRSIEIGWKSWGRKGTCTADGRMTWRDVQALAIVTEAVDGEYIIYHRPGFRNRFQYAVQFIDPDRLDITFNRPANIRKGENRVVMGVEVDADTRPIAYWFTDQHPAEVGESRRRSRVDAQFIEHGYLVQRSDQYRGVPWAAPILLSLNMFDGYTEAELVAARSSASKPLFYEQDAESVDANEDTDAELVDEIAPGYVGLLPAGVTPHQMDPQHPNGAFEQFQKAILRGVASGLGVSYSAMTGDLRDVNFSSIRTGLLQERDIWRSLQRHHIDNLADPVMRKWLQFAVAADQVTLPSRDHERWADAQTWKPRGWAWVDPVKDVMAAEAGIALGTTTRTAVCDALGVDFEDNMDQLRREQDLADAKGVDISGLKLAAIEGANNGGQGQDGPAVSGGNGRGRADAGDGDGGRIGLGEYRVQFGDTGRED